MSTIQHLQEELLQSPARLVVETQYGPIIGGRALNGACAFLEVPYALPPARFTDAEPLPSDYRYVDKNYVYESSYAAQPLNDGQAGASPLEDKVGLGEPTENPLFVNIVCPPSFPTETGFPVKVYIHGGFLQFGSPHGLSGQAQYISAARSEVWVNIGYRLSAFGFLASDEPNVDGNFGFKDQWLALLWVRDNIKVFGGNPGDIQVVGLSAGAHSVHQHLHHVSRLPDGQNAPFHSAVLQSNAIVVAPRTPQELRPQFRAFCRALDLDPDGSDVLSKLRDPNVVPWSSITRAIETYALEVQYGTFRGCLDGTWLSNSPDPMTWQRSGDFARALTTKGVRSIVVGELTEEWYLYSIVQPVSNMRDIERVLEACYQAEIVKKMMALYTPVPEGSPVGDFEKIYGEIFSDGQVYLPVRLLARDLINAGFPVLRYQIRWTPEQVRPLGYVTHGTDRALWALRLPNLLPSDIEIAHAWLDAVATETEALHKEGASKHAMTQVLALKEDQTIAWIEDSVWAQIMRLREALPGEIL